MNFVQLMEQIEPVMRQANKLLNDQRSKDQEIFDLWSKHRLEPVSSMPSA